MTTEVQGLSTKSEGELDWAGVRAEFPVAENYAYLNSAGAGPVSRGVAEVTGSPSQAIIRLK